MGITNSNSKPTITLKKRQFEPVKLLIPYQQLEMIKLLQSTYSYEVKGALYFDHANKFKSFEIRTDNSEIESSGGSDWKLYFHTHPDKTAAKYGLRYYSPPSVADVMEIYEHSAQYLPETVAQSLGEISLVVTNEGIYLMQAHREFFKTAGLNQMTDEELEDKLEAEFNPFIVDFIKDKIKAIYELEGWGQPNLEDPDKLSYDQFSKMVKALTVAVTTRFGFKLEFYDWKELSESGGLELNTSSYFVNKRVVD